MTTPSFAESSLGRKLTSKRVRSHGEHAGKRVTDVFTAMVSGSTAEVSDAKSSLSDAKSSPGDV